jgi:hypothetical protein
MKDRTNILALAATLGKGVQIFLRDRGTRVQFIAAGGEVLFEADRAALFDASGSPFEIID